MNLSYLRLLVCIPYVPLEVGCRSEVLHFYSVSGQATTQLCWWGGPSCLWTNPCTFEGMLSHTVPQWQRVCLWAAVCRWRILTILSGRRTLLQPTVRGRPFLQPTPLIVAPWPTWAHTPVHCSMPLAAWTAQHLSPCTGGDYHCQGEDQLMAGALKHKTLKTHVPAPTHRGRGHGHEDDGHSGHQCPQNPWDCGWLPSAVGQLHQWDHNPRDILLHLWCCWQNRWHWVLLPHGHGLCRALLYHCSEPRTSTM